MLVQICQDLSKLCSYVHTREIFAWGLVQEKNPNNVQVKAELSWQTGDVPSPSWVFLMFWEIVGRVKPLDKTLRRWGLVCFWPCKQLKEGSKWRRQQWDDLGERLMLVRWCAGWRLANRCSITWQRTEQTREWPTWREIARSLYRRNLHDGD